MTISEALTEQRRRIPLYRDPRRFGTQHPPRSPRSAAPDLRPGGHPGGLPRLRLRAVGPTGVHRALLRGAGDAGAARAHHQGPALFSDVRRIGARLLWLHTYGERFVPPDETRGHIPPGSAKCLTPVPGDPERYPESFTYNETTHTLRVGAGEFAPVAPAVFEFEVSGLKVVESWLKYRMKGGAGRKSSPLDDIGPERWTSQLTTELLELLWVLEKTIAGYPEQEHLLEEVIASECLPADELSAPPKSMRKAPRPERTYVRRLF